MWPFRKKPKQSEEEYGPMEMLFASYILDVIGHLSAEVEEDLAAGAAPLAAALKTTASNWKGIVVEALHLSETIDYAILDLWYRNTDIARDSGTTLAPNQFARMFVIEYRKEGSPIDVWLGDSLAQAKARIATRRSQ
jgi:hypothetical protein